MEVRSPSSFPEATKGIEEEEWSNKNNSIIKCQLVKQNPKELPNHNPGLQAGDIPHEKETAGHKHNRTIHSFPAEIND